MALSLTIRPPRAGDGRGINTLRRMPGVFETILGIPSEREGRSEQFVVTDNRNAHLFVAVHTDEQGCETIVGMASLSVNESPRLRHSGGIGLMVHRDFQNQGIGSRLMEALLDIADQWLMLVRVELTVFADNERAIHLYEKYGFVAEGVKRMAAIRQGQYCDELLMARIRRE